MIYRHFIAPTRGYTSFSNAIIRHPRLGSDACRLLTWQLSLPAGATESLSRTAERCGIGASAFTRAKRQLMAEGFVHERRVQGARGQWATQQLVSCVPLRAGEAVKIMAGLPVGDDGAARVFPQVAPSTRGPAVGAPSGRPADGHPSGEDLVARTSNHPSLPDGGSWAGGKPAPAPARGPESEWEPELEPAGGPGSGPEAGVKAEPEAGVEAGAERSSDPEPAREGPGPRSEPEPALEPRSEPSPEPHPAPGDPELHRQARELVASLPRLTPDLRGVPVAMRRELAGLVLRWLEAGHTARDVCTHLLRGMPSDGSPVLRPGGLVRYLLREVPPVGASSAPGNRAHLAASPPPVPARSAAVTDLRECEGDHDTVTVFRPRGGELLCGRCLRGEASGAGGEVPAARPLPAF
jgi:hypothetical protein